MYSHNYSRAKFGLEAQPAYKPRGKSCGYYMRIVFFFSSLIQSLIIVSLVLFVVYGQPEKAVEEKRLQELEQTYNRMSENNIKLRKEKADLGAQLGARTGEKAALQKELDTLKDAANITTHELLALQKKMTQCEADKKQALTRTPPTLQCATTSIRMPATPNGEVVTLRTLNNQQRAMINLIEANFTQTVLYLSQERDNALRDRDTHHQSVIGLRRDNVNQKEQLETYTRKCKEDFAKSLEGIQTVTTGFLDRINSLFNTQPTFHLTCEKQQEQNEKIRTGCTNLSRDVEDKFQKYLDNVGIKVSQIQSESSRLEVQNNRLSQDLQRCTRNRTMTAAESSRLQQTNQQKHDKQVETLLIEQNRLREEKRLQGERLSLRENELETVKKNVQKLTTQLANCKPAVPQPAALQAEPPRQRRSIVAKLGPSIGAPGISKTPTVY